MNNIERRNEQLRKSVKRNKIVTVIMGIMIAVGFTSCKIDNADNRLKEETEFALKRFHLRAISDFQAVHGR